MMAERSKVLDIGASPLDKPRAFAEMVVSTAKLLVARRSTVYVVTLTWVFMSTENVEMTPAQCRAARALLDWTQPKLAESASLGLSTVVDFERVRRAVSEDAAQSIRTALERAGVIFVDENGEGPGVRLKKKARKK